MSLSAGRHTGSGQDERQAHFTVCAPSHSFACGNAPSPSAWGRQQQQQTELSASTGQWEGKKRSLWNQRGQMRGNAADQCGMKTAVQRRDTISNAGRFSCHPSRIDEWSFGVCCQAAHQWARLFRTRSWSCSQSSEAPKESGRDHHIWMILIHLFRSTSQCVHKCLNEAN